MQLRRKSNEINSISENALFLYLLLFLAAFWANSVTKAEPVWLQGYSAHVEQARMAWNVPGLAVAIVKDDKVVFAQGFGVRQLGHAEGVDTGTIFSIGSTTKAFTSTAMALLVDQGKVDWDAPVIRYLPGFRVEDPYVTRELKVRDLLIHSSGTQAANLLWKYGGYSRDEIVRRLQYAPQVASLRSRWSYNNTMYIVAGEVIEAVSGVSWEQFVREQILDPLAMHETRMVSTGIEDCDNVAMAHDELEGSVTVLPFPHIDETGPAGSMQSNVADMARWLCFLLNNNETNERSLLKPQTHAELFRRQMVLEPHYPAAKLAEPLSYAYGLAWFLQDLHGRRLAMHTGSIDGMSALIGLLPDEKVGIVVLANHDHAELRHALMYDVFDRYMGKTERDWSADLLRLYGKRKSQADQERAKRESNRAEGTSPTLPLDDYVGTYTNDLYGAIEISRDSSGLVLRWMGPRRTTAALEHWHYNSFQAVFRKPWHDEHLVRFELDGSGHVSEFEFANAIAFQRCK